MQLFPCIKKVASRFIHDFIDGVFPVFIMSSVSLSMDVGLDRESTWLRSEESLPFLIIACVLAMNT